MIISSGFSVLGLSLVTIARSAYFLNDLCHTGSFGFVPVTAAAEYDNEDGLYIMAWVVEKNVIKSIVGMSKINENSKRQIEEGTLSSRPGIASSEDKSLATVLSRDLRTDTSPRQQDELANIESAKQRRFIADTLPWYWRVNVVPVVTRFEVRMFSGTNKTLLFFNSLQQIHKSYSGFS